MARRGSITLAALALAGSVAGACSDDGGGGGSTGTTPAPGPSTTSTSVPATTTTLAAAPQVIVFNGQGNDLAAYLAEPPFTKQIVIPRYDEDESPEGLDINAQICFDPENPRRFVAGEDTHQPDPPPGWGIFELQGDAIGELAATQVGKLTPTYQSADDNAENYGCGFLPDGRILTTDIGNQAAGPANGQLIVWYPPFDSFDVAYCKLDITAGTAQQIAVDGDDVYVAQARGPGRDGLGPGVYRYDAGEFPASAEECDSTDATGAPFHEVVPELFIGASEETGIATPNAIVGALGGNWYVSSVINGVIGEFTHDGEFVRRVLEPPAGEALGPEPLSTGTPLGLGVGPDGALYFADIGIVVDGGIGPGQGTGKVRRITFDDDGIPSAPEIMDEGLAFPDGIGIWVVPA